MDYKKEIEFLNYITILIKSLENMIENNEIGISYIKNIFDYENNQIKEVKK